MAGLILNGAEDQEIILDGSYIELGASATDVDGTETTIQPNVALDTSDLNSGSPHVLVYDFTDTDTTAYQVTRDVTVIAPVGVVDTTFDLGDENRAGDNISGSAFDTALDLNASDAEANPLPASSSAWFSETAMDPYEVASSK